jgi:hypothetical protein
MAPTGRKQVAPGQLIQSSAWGNPLWDQSVQCFASPADRANQYPNPHPGAVSFCEDFGTLDVYRGGKWQPILAKFLLSTGQVPTQSVVVASGVSLTSNVYGQLILPHTGVTLAAIDAVSCIHWTADTALAPVWFQMYATTQYTDTVMVVARNVAGAIVANTTFNVFYTIYGRTP